MKNFRAQLGTLVGLVCSAGLFVNVGCGGSGAAANGGHGGGTAGTGGATGGTGGATAGTSGATAGTGGATGGKGGTTGGIGGVVMDGGAGSHGDAGVAAFAYYFDKDTEGFALNAFGGGANLADMDGGTPATLAWDGTVGTPNLGSLKVGATFTGYNQYVLTSIVTGPPLDGTGKTIHAWVRLDAGTFSGGAQLAATAGQAYVGSIGTWTTLKPGIWTELTLDLGAAQSENANFDPSRISQISVQFSTGQGPLAGGTFAPVSAVFHIDSITDGSGGAPPPALSLTFDKSDETFGPSTNIPTPAGGSGPATTWDSTVGNPAPGSLEINASFTDYGQYVSADVRLSPLTDLTGKVVHAQLRLDAGSLPMGSAQIQAFSGNTFVAAGGAKSALTAGVWTDLTVDLTAAHAATPTFDPTQIIQISVSIQTALPADAGAFPAPGNLVFHLDSVVAE